MTEQPLIKVWDYLEELEEERADILEGIAKVLASGRLILGESGLNFEAAFSAYCGVRHGVGVDNATNGLFLALKALGIGPGDEVITVSNTAVPTLLSDGRGAVGSRGDAQDQMHFAGAPLRPVRGYGRGAGHGLTPRAACRGGLRPGPWRTTER